MQDSISVLARLEGVPSAVAAATAAVDAVLRDRGRRPIAAAERSAAWAVSAAASAQLSESPDLWLPGALRLAAELTALAPLITRAPGQALARAHVLAARGVVPDDELGRIRAGIDRTGRVTDLQRLLTTPSTGSSLVLGAVVHAEIATLGLFDRANDLVARFAEHAVLVAGGLDPDGVIAVEAGHLADRPGYEAGLSAYAGGGGGVKQWLLHCAGAVTRGAELTPAGTSARRPPPEGRTP